MKMRSISFDKISEIATARGFILAGWGGVEPLLEDRHRLEEWQASGYAGDMAYMNRDAELLSDPRRILPEARSIISVALPYPSDGEGPCPEDHGKVARYAWGRDYHKMIPKLLHSVVEEISKDLGVEINYRVFTDAVPALERAIASRSRLGFIGKNTMLIHPGAGSFFFLGEILWDIEIKESTLQIVESSRAKASCGSCTQCISACPTNAIIAERKLDANKCISYLTIEKSGILNDWEIKAVGEWIFGCDICQEVCPFNHASQKKVIPGIHDFWETKRVGKTLSIKDVLSVPSHEAFTKRYGGTAIMRTGREGLLRNACAVAVNKRIISVLPELKRCMEQDESVVVRQQAEAAYRILRG